MPIVGRVLPIIADEYVDPAFGTGAVKVTPAHDPNDFEMGQRHSLPSIRVIGNDGAMTADAGDDYAGLDRYECRRKLVADLEAEGFLVKIEEHAHAVGHCQRCDTVVEPLVSKQWFVRMQPLAEPAMEAVAKGLTEFVPEPVYQDLYELAGAYPRLVYFAADLVGASNSGLVLRGVR